MVITFCNSLKLYEYTLLTSLKLAKPSLFWSVNRMCVTNYVSPVQLLYYQGLYFSVSGHIQTVRLATVLDRDSSTALNYSWPVSFSSELGFGFKHKYNPNKK